MPSTDNDAYRESKTKIAASAFVAIGLVVALSVGGWFLYWRLAQSAAGHQAHINRSTYEFQATARQQVENYIGTIRDIDVQITTATAGSVAALRAQREAVINQACQLALQINGGDVPVDISTFTSADCPTGAP